MCEYKKYQHIERLGTDEVSGILNGMCYIFPKIDGTNGKVWFDNGVLRAGSRNRELTLENDNRGFYKYITTNDKYYKFFSDYPDYTLWGEWLVPHTIKHYRDDAWNKFYVFDVSDENNNYIPYDKYSVLLDQYEIDFIPVMVKIKSPVSLDVFETLLDNNTYLVSGDRNKGEGIVIKNYGYKNKYGRQTWAKIVRDEYKRTRATKKRPNDINIPTERIIVFDFLTPEIIDKEYEKTIDENSGWTSKYIPQLLGSVWNTFIREECWNIVKKYKYPTIDFKLLHSLVIERIKELKPNLF
jgi:hypothetical protein